MTIQDKIINRINRETLIHGSLRELSYKIWVHESYIIRIREWKQKLSTKMIKKFSDYFNL